MGTTRIECIDCSEPRDVPNASKHLVKRCKDCQDEYNRIRALERYYERTGRKPKKKKTKEKKEEKKKETAEEPKRTGWLAGPKPKKSKMGVTANMTPEEAEEFHKNLWEKAFGPGTWEDQTTIADW